MGVGALLCVAAVAVSAAAASSLAVDRLTLDMTKGRVARRYCSCHDKGNRGNMTYQTCVIKKDSLHGLVCKSETLPFANRWYKYTPGIRGIYMLFSNEMAFYEAEKVCEEENARLSVPLNKRGYDDLHTEMKARPESLALLGINDRRVEGTYVDSDGSKPAYLPWGSSLPDNLHGKDCVHVYGQNAIQDTSCYYWYKAFVCERRMSKSIPYGYTYQWYTHRFYRHYDEKRSHAAARKRCEQDGGTLAAFDSWSNAEIIPKILKSNVKVWVDYTDEEVEGQFVTSTGMLLEDTDFINWYPGQPDNGGGKKAPENCVLIAKTGEYFDADCSAQHSFVCEIKIY